MCGFGYQQIKYRNIGIHKLLLNLTEKQNRSQEIHDFSNLCVDAWGENTNMAYK